MNWQAVEAIASGVVALGVFVAVFQLWQSKGQNITAFEDGLSRQYREIFKTIPVKALLKEELTQDEITRAKGGIYFYLDLCNEQAFLRYKGRVTKSTWKDWSDGIRLNLSLPEFEKVWKEIKLKAPPGIFGEFRRLEDSAFKDDPRSWYWHCLCRSLFK